MRPTSSLARNRSLLVRIGMLAGLAFAGLSLGGCIVYAPPYHHYRGYY